VPDPSLRSAHSYYRNIRLRVESAAGTHHPLAPSYARFLNHRLRPENLGTVLVEDVRVVASFNMMKGLRVLDDLPEEPYSRMMRIGPIRRLDLNRPSRSTRVRVVGDTWEVTALVGKVQANSTAWSRPFWVGSSEQVILQLVARLHGDSIGRAVEAPLTIKVEVEDGTLEEGEPTVV
jgi:hypothetical protein